MARIEAWVYGTWRDVQRTARERGIVFVATGTGADMDDAPMVVGWSPLDQEPALKAWALERGVHSMRRFD